VKISPFIPTIYSDGLGRVTSPPFDMLSREEEKKLTENPKNIINLKRCRDPEEARLLFTRWIEEGTLTRYPSYSFVALKQSFEIGGKMMERYGIIGVLCMEDNENKLIPHEDTIGSLVSERSKLIERMEYQTEPVFVVNDNDQLVTTLKGIMSKKNCDRHYEEPMGVINSICIVSDPDNVNSIRDSLAGSKGIIADGHHRMKAMISLSDKYEQRVSFFNHVFVYVTSLNADSVLIGAVHRIIRINDTTIPYISKYFELVETEKDMDDNIAVVHMRGKKYSMKPRHTGDFFEYLTTIETCISRKHRKGTIFYSPNLNIILKKMEQAPDDIGIVMPPWKKSDFMRIVENERTLPAKSTYFYPKIPSGIAFYG
jgi:Uncharacterized conserved protein